MIVDFMAVTECERVDCKVEHTENAAEEVDVLELT